MSKKVGILTFHWANHFGATLQAWALNKTLIGMGYEAKIINFLPWLTLVQSRVLKPSKLAKKHLTSGNSLVKGAYRIAIEPISYIYNLKNSMHKNSLFNHFRKCFMRVSSKAVNNINELKQECLKYDICLVGSDQVWNPDFLSYSDFAYLLPFRLEGVKKVAFSASIAIEDIPLSLVKLYKAALPDFSFISLREKTHCRFLSLLLGREVYNTLDPTLLVSRESFEAVMNKNMPLPYDKYILVYNLELSLLPLAKKLADAIKLPVIIHRKSRVHPITRKSSFPEYFKTAPFFSLEGPRELLTLLRNAELVITDSFHGTILSILFEKPFITAITNAKRKSRILDLLKLFELKKRLFTPRKTLREIIHESIDYTHVRKLLNDARRSSLELLTTALKN